MSTRGGQWCAVTSFRSAKRMVWAVGAMLALAYAGDGAGPSWRVAAQESAPPSPHSSASLSDPTTGPNLSSGTNVSAQLTPETSVQGDKTSEGTVNNANSRKIPPKEKLEKILARRGTVVMRDATLADWMFAINGTWNVDILFDHAELQRLTCSGTFTDATLEEVLFGILPPKGLSFRKLGNGISIVRQEETGVNPQQQSKVIPLKYNQPADIEPTLKYLLSPQGKTQAIPSAMAVMVLDLPENVEQVAKYIATLEEMARVRVEKEEETERLKRDAEAQAARGSDADGAGDASEEAASQIISTVLRPKFVQAVDIQETIQNQIGDGIVSAIEAENALALIGSRQSITAATQLLEQIDIPRRQVKISVMMYDISVDALEHLGFNWRNAGKNNTSADGVPNGLFDLHSAPLAVGASGPTAAATTAATGGAAAATTATAAPFGGFITSATPNLVGSVVNMYHVSRHFDISAVIEALQQTDGARLLANPTVFVYNLEQSEIRIVSEIPVQQLTQTEAGGNIGTTTFREAGITLSVLPEIADDTWVRLTVSPEFSALRGFQNGQPIIDRRQANTKVLMMTGDTLVLGGLRRRNEIETVAGVPGLMNIKYLGNLFRSHRTTISESELIIFIQAQIVSEGTCVNEPRQQMAFRVAAETLDDFPEASHLPYIPNCNDPYCPYHNPPPRPQEEWYRLHPECIHADELPPVPPANQPEPPREELPPRKGEPIPVEPAPEVSGNYGASDNPMEVQPIERQLVVPRRPSEIRSDIRPIERQNEPPNPVDFEASQRQPLDRRQTIENTIPARPHSTPPPVVVDQTAATQPASAVVVGRLPRVESPPASPTPRLPLAAATSRPSEKRPKASAKTPTNPKERIAQAPRRSETTAKPTTGSTGAPESQKASWLGEIFR